MKRLVWVTDIHLEFCPPQRLDAFCASIRAAEPDAVLLGGDVAQAGDLVDRLRFLERTLERPIYFVLGNHDFYGDSIAAVRARAAELSRRSTRLKWLVAEGVVPLTHETGLIGHDGWGDARLGDPLGTTAILADFGMIEELRAVWRGEFVVCPDPDPSAAPSRQEFIARLNALGDEAAAQVREVLPRALESHRRAILLTHVPPFRESCWHEGRPSDDDHLPYFACKAVGDALLDLMRARPDRELLVLCGHTHGAGTVQVLPNLRVKTGGAVYGWPEIQEVLEVP